MASVSFFEALTPAASFFELSQSKTASVPNDWEIFITDVRNSTVAIQNGKYKEVNIAGALCITAIINSGYYGKIPFVFGGDGITFLVPPEARGEFADLMHGVRKFTSEAFGLDLRIGIVPAQTLYQNNKSIAVGKYRFGHGAHFAVFEGDGIDYAESLVKEQNSAYLLAPDHRAKIEVNFE